MSNAVPSGIAPEFTLGDRLRKAREIAGMTTDDMARAIGVSDRTIRNYENEVTPAKRATVISWALSTGVAFDWLLTGHRPEPTDPSHSEGYPLRSCVTELIAA